jgi:hypothetical protein
MSGLLFLLFNVGVVLVAHWCVQNDSKGDDPTKGLFAMARRAQSREPATRKVGLPSSHSPRLGRR